MNKSSHTRLERTGRPPKSSFVVTHELIEEWVVKGSFKTCEQTLLRALAVGIQTRIQRINDTDGLVDDGFYEPLTCKPCTAYFIVYLPGITASQAARISGLRSSSKSDNDTIDDRDSALRNMNTLMRDARSLKNIILSKQKLLMTSKIGHHSMKAECVRSEISILQQQLKEVRLQIAIKRANNDYSQ